ncbi:unnamed protein product [Prorocentrum cordatum]|uniref:Uncharacterized protein n=1 Tax=Prorocentrum cordatum TaxID=2364126 RepID=A0ABN9QY51_9DINO|nr:unnamed protein product [Polarella glacialis]
MAGAFAGPLSLPIAARGQAAEPPPAAGGAPACPQRVRPLGDCLNVWRPGAAAPGAPAPAAGGARFVELGSVPLPAPPLAPRGAGAALSWPGPRPLEQPAAAALGTAAAAAPGPALGQAAPVALSPTASPTGMAEGSPMAASPLAAGSPFGFLPAHLKSPGPLGSPVHGAEAGVPRRPKPRAAPARRL